jgi:hypothetical protein
MNAPPQSTETQILQVWHRRRVSRYSGHFQVSQYAFPFDETAISTVFIVKLILVLTKLMSHTYFGTARSWSGICQMSKAVANTTQFLLRIS